MFSGLEADGPICFGIADAVVCKNCKLKAVMGSIGDFDPRCWISEPAEIAFCSFCRLARRRPAYNLKLPPLSCRKKNPRSLRRGGRWDGGGNLLTGEKLHESVEFIQ